MTSHQGLVVKQGKNRPSAGHLRIVYFYPCQQALARLRHQAGRSFRANRLAREHGYS